MRKRWCLFILIAAVLLMACGPKEEEKQEVYSVTKAGNEYVVDTVNSTITADGEVYRYAMTGDSDSENYVLRIIFPDDSWWRVKGTDKGGYQSVTMEQSADFDWS